MKLLARLHYVTIDAVNASWAEELAARAAVPLEVVEPRDLPRLEEQQAHLVLDWDHLPDDERVKLLNGTAKVVAVHGYNLSESLTRFLPRRGIHCSPRLDDSFFQSLRADDANSAA